MWIILSAFGISYNYLIKVARYKLIDLSWGQKINEEMGIISLFMPFTTRLAPVLITFFLSIYHFI